MANDQSEFKTITFDGEEALRMLGIVESFAKVGRPSAMPKFVIVMGGVGSGKSTIRSRNYAEGYVHFEYGDIYNAVRKEFGKDNERVIPYTHFVAEMLLRTAIEEKKDIVTEIIGDDYNTLKPVIEKMREIGYKPDVVGVHADVAEARQRHLKRTREDPDYISVYFTQNSTLSFFYSHFKLPNNPGISRIPEPVTS